MTAIFNFTFSNQIFGENTLPTAGKFAVETLKDLLGASWMQSAIALNLSQRVGRSPDYYPGSPSSYYRVRDELTDRGLMRERQSVTPAGYDILVLSRSMSQNLHKKITGEHYPDHITPETLEFRKDFAEIVRNDWKGSAIEKIQLLASALNTELHHYGNLAKVSGPSNSTVYRHRLSLTEADPPMMIPKTALLTPAGQQKLLLALRAFCL